MKPFFSIVIPVYNTEKYIEQCIISCLSQTFKEIEYIFVDDCGNDDSIKIVLDYQKKDQRISVIHNPNNMGLLKTRSNGVNKARGKYCLFVDSDDYISPDLCKRLHEIITKKNQPDIVHYRIKHTPFCLFQVSPKTHPGFLHQPKMRNFLNINNAFQSLCDKTIKTDLLRQSYQIVNDISEKINLMEDGLVILILTKLAQTYYGVGAKFYFYRSNQNSMTRKISKKHFLQQLEAFQKLLDAIDRLILIFPDDLIIKKYKNKIASAVALNSRFYSILEYKKTFALLKKYKLTKNMQIGKNIYLRSCLLSLRYFYRWQTLARICLYLFTFGKIKL